MRPKKGAGVRGAEAFGLGGLQSSELLGWLRVFLGAGRGCMEQVSTAGRMGLLKPSPSFSKLHPDRDLGFQQVLKGVQSRKIELAFVES